MGRSHLAFAAAIAVLAGCQPLYGGKPEKPGNPPKRKRPPEQPEAKVEVKYVEDCVTNFRDDPKRVVRDTAGANRYIGNGDDALGQARQKSKDPQAQAKLITVGIDAYRQALLRDPFNAEATLKLAIAYDRVLRKGCALKLLGRIAQLEGNDKFRREAKRAADQVADTPEWFRGYRNDAKQAVGR